MKISFYRLGEGYITFPDSRVTVQEDQVILDGSLIGRIWLASSRWCVQGASIRFRHKRDAIGYLVQQATR